MYRKTMMNGLALVLGIGLILMASILFFLGFLMGMKDVLKTAMVFVVLATVSLVSGQGISGAPFYVVAFLILAAAVETIRYYEAA